MINLANLSTDHPMWISEEEYEQLKNRKRRGWTHCDSQREWMVKLHYLRTGYKEGKMGKDAFSEKEKELVLNWWLRWSQYE